MRSSPCVSTASGMPRETGRAGTGRIADVHTERSTRVPHACLLVYLTIWIALAIRPSDRAAWMLENLIPVTGVPLAVLGFRRFRWSDSSYVQATLLLILHAIGAHYTYSATPIGEWIGGAFGLGRNHYDRVVHFAFGLLMFAPCRELFFRPPARVPWMRQLGLSVAVIAAFSTAYELLEWCTAIVVDPSAGNAFLGTQGDVWDAQKDTLCACIGALIAAAVSAALRRSAVSRTRWGASSITPL